MSNQPVNKYICIWNSIMPDEFMRAVIILRIYFVPQVEKL